MILRSIVVVVCAGLSAGAASAAGETGGGISDVSTRVTRSGAQKLRTNAVERERGGAMAQADERVVQASNESSAPEPGVQAIVQPAVIGCDFGGFPDRDQVAMAYAGGTSSSGVSRQNFGVSFSGAVVLNTFNGSGAPNPGVVYAPGSGTGRIVAAFTQFDAVNVEFSYASKVPVQLLAYASSNGTGSPISTFTINPNIAMPGGFSSWAQVSQALPPGTRSVAFEGQANFWGIDAFVATGHLAGSAVAEFYNTENCGATPGTGWAGTFAAMGQPAISLTSLSSLSGVGALFINNYNNCGAGPMIANTAVIASFVQSGGVLVVHDRWGLPGSWVPGAAGIVSTRNVGTNIDRGAAAAEFVDGVSGSISNSDLDGGNYSHHGYMCTGLPSGARVVLTQGSCAVAVAYPFGSGWVYYSTIPLDFYQAGYGPNPPRDNFLRYAQNVARTMIARTGCPAPASATDDCNGNGQSDACEIARGLVQDCNGNGVPDSCDIAGGFVTHIARFSSYGDPRTYTEDDIVFTSEQDHVHMDSGSSMMNHSGCCTTPIRITHAGGKNFTLRSMMVLRQSGNSWLEGSNGQSVSLSVGTMNFGSTFANVAWVRWHEGYSQSEIDDVMIEVGTPGVADCNTNGVIDSCEIASGAVADCNANGVPDTCDIASGLAFDCNGNGSLDSCDLANGSAVDQNGNGVPDSCDPFPTLTLTANAAACNAVGSEIDIEARLSGVLNLVVAGQLVLDWDPIKLELVSSSAGDAPYDTSFLVNNAAGQAVILVSTAPGGSGTTSQSAIVSRLRFRVLGGSCDGSGTSVGFGSFAGALTTTFTDGFGGSVVPTLVASNGFVVDDGAPVLSDVPANISVQAFAGEGGSAFVTLGMPTATDACAPGLTATGVRSDGQALGAAWPSGTTTVTWSATDPCGNTTTATTSVTVDPTNTLDLAVNVGYGYYGAPRTLSLAVLGSMGTQTRSASVSVMWDGSATFSVTDLPVDTYDCVTIEDTARSLRARVSISDTGSVWSAAAANLIQGDVINDEVIDVLDWGAYIVRNANADFNGDGLLNSLDGDVILANFGKRGDSACGAGSPERAAITAISVSDLVAMGMPELAGADLNGDGMLDTADMELAGN